MEFPTEWEEDQSMDVLFSPFRERRVNPVSWDRKMKFWTELILQYCRSAGSIIIDTKTVPHIFERKGKIPVCLFAVLEEMTRQGKLMKHEDFKLNSSTSWSSWGFNVLVKKPASWAMTAFVKTPLSWTYGKVTGTSADEEPTSQHLIVVDILKEKADLLFLQQQTNMEHERTDCIIGYEELYNLNKELVPVKEDFNLVITQLCNDSRCVVFEAENQEKVVRFAKKAKRSVTPPTESDTKIYKLKLAEKTLQEQIEKLTKEMERLRIEAKHLLNQGQKQSAKSCLRKKKKYEQLRSQKETSLENIQHIMTAIQQADSNKMVLDAYSSGSEAFKELQKQHGLKSNSIDDVMIDLEQTFEDTEEINRSMATTPVYDPELADLEEELDAILAEADDTSQSRVHSPGGVAVPKLSDLATEGSRVPHQELLDSMCRMKVSEEEDASLFELPSAPSFDPTVSRDKLNRHRHQDTSNSPGKYSKPSAAYRMEPAT